MLCIRSDLLYTSVGYSFLLELKNLFNPWYFFSATLVCFFNPLPNGKYSNLFNAVAFSDKSVSGKTSLSVKNSYLLTFPDDKAKIILSFILLDFVTDCFDFLPNTHFYNNVFLNRNRLSNDKVVSFTKNENVSLV